MATTRFSATPGTGRGAGFNDPRRVDNPVTGGLNSLTGQPLKKFSQTQATLPNVPPGVNNGGSSADAIATSGAGVGATDDSGGQNNSQQNTQNNQDKASSQSTVSGTLNGNTKRQITPRSNVLDNFSSYTYRASVYLMNPTEYERLIRSKKKIINGYNLLFQSAGAPNNVGGFQGALNSNNQAIAQDAAAGGLGSGVDGTSIPGAGQTSAGRNPAFTEDFYIDSITVKNLLQGKGTGAAHNINDLKFTVAEPTGITLLDRLYQAVQDHNPKDGAGKVNYASAQYLMVIRFYGYDQSGNLVPGIGGADPQAGLSDPNAVIEKYIPFAIRNINWTVSSKLVTYDFDCSPVAQLVAGGTRRGAVPFDMQLSGGTVNSILTGPPTVTTDQSSRASPPAATQTRSPPPSAVGTGRGAGFDDPRRVDNRVTGGINTTTGQSLNSESQASAGAPAKANAAPNPKKTFKTGLSSALSEFNATLTKGNNPIYEQADEYEIVFAKGAEAIRDASLVLPGSKKEASQSPVNAVPTTDPKSAGNKADAKDTTAKSISIVAGQPIVQIIDTVIRNSSYITDQALTKIDAATGNEMPNPAATGKPVRWYRINFEAIPKPSPDKLRNDYAYKIRYIISAYTIDKYDSKYFPVGSFRGVHKSYPWWFTGQNTAVLDYTETLNQAWTTLISSGDATNTNADKERRKVAATMREMITYTYGPASEESRQGSRTNGNEATANMADSLYSPGDLGTSKIKIIGDPAWLQQGSLCGGVNPEEFDSSSFLPDGTINFDAEQVFYEVQWNRPNDYNLETGLADPNANKTYTTVSRVYLANGCTSEFKQGKFEQTIEGGLFLIPKPDGSNKAPSAPMPTKSNSERAKPFTTATQAEIARNAPPGQTNVVGGRLVTNTEGGAALVAPRAGRRGTVPSPNVPLPDAGETPAQTPAPPGPKDNVRPAQINGRPVVSNGENISVVDRFLGFLSGQKTTPPQDIARDD
jgi:hypothetical protein